MQVNLVISTDTLAHKIAGGRTQTVMYLPIGASARWALESLKAEALDAFGLLDVSIDDEEM